MLILNQEHIGPGYRKFCKFRSPMHPSSPSQKQSLKSINKLKILVFKCTILITKVMYRRAKIDRISINFRFQQIGYIAYKQLAKNLDLSNSF